MRLVNHHIFLINSERLVKFRSLHVRRVVVVFAVNSDIFWVYENNYDSGVLLNN